MSTPIIWLHGDSLSPTDPALAAHPAAPAIFVFDEIFLRSAGLSFKRLLFIYESALEALAGRDGEIRRGEVIAELLDFRAARGGDAIHVSASVAPRFAGYVARLRELAPVTIHQPQPLVGWHGEAPRRFSAFWRKVADEAMRPRVIADSQ
jgi:deoxyribodipyrimidine photo-lyase